MKIAVIGLGYVGLVSAACFAELGHDVMAVDNDAKRITVLQGGGVPIHEALLPELLARHCGSRLRFTASLPEAVRCSDVLFIAVGTPSSGSGDADLSYVERVAQEVAREIDSFKVIVEKSTVPVYTCERIRHVLSLNGVSPDAYDVCSNPEFLREGTAVTDFLYPDRIVIGADADLSAQVLAQIYSPLVSGRYYKAADAIPRQNCRNIPPRLIVTKAKSAELIKHASNAFLAMKISFINAVAQLCDNLGVDVSEVREGLGSDKRIGDAFLQAGIGYGGSCFPKDIKALQRAAQETGYDFSLLQEVMKINAAQHDQFLRKIRKQLWTLKGKRLGVLGLAFKGGTDDVRESPAIAVVRDLVSRGCHIVAYDPAAVNQAKELIGHLALEFVEDAYKAARDADALLILTDWEEFSQLDLKRMYSELKYPIVIDGRNLYDPDVMRSNGFTYVSIGRPDAFPLNNSGTQILARRELPQTLDRRVPTPNATLLSPPADFTSSSTA
jgi:UDPglucose 6-dehydrogenase